jgi:putative transposase
MLDFRQQLINSTLSKVLQRLHYPLEVMLTCVRWYVAYPLSLRHVEEIMLERGVFVDYSYVHRWAIKILLVMAAVFCRRKRPVGVSWRMDETYIKVAGQWKYLHRAVDRAGDTVDSLLTAKRNKAAARRFLERAINLHRVPEKITIDKSGANTAAIESVKADACVDILMRLNKYLNNIVEQEHRAVKRVTQPMLGFKSFWSARILIGGIRDNAHDSQGPDAPARRINRVRSGSVLQLCRLKTRPTKRPFSAILY